MSCLPSLVFGRGFVSPRLEVESVRTSRALQELVGPAPNPPDTYWYDVRLIVNKVRLARGREDDPSPESAPASEGGSPQLSLGAVGWSRPACKGQRGATKH